MRLKVNLRVAAVFAVLLIASSAMAGVVTRHYEFSEPIIKLDGDYHRISMRDAWNHGEPGEPVLPMVGARLLLPPGEVVSEVRVTPGEKVVLGHGYTVEPGQRQYPLSHAGPRVLAEADYPNGASYPASLHGEAVFGRFRGYGIANVALSPVEYDVDGGTLSYYTSMDVEIITEPDPAGMRDVQTMIRHDDVTLGRLSSMVDNVFDAGQYSSVERIVEMSRTLDPALGYDYIIVTSNAWDDYLADFIDFQTERGFTVGMFTREYIALNYGGSDIQTQVRNFIIDAYATWTPEYLLIVGDGEPTDSNGITARGFYNDAYGTVDENIASDLYYSCLDGNWNSDGDGYYGEDGEEDFYPELAVGRVACSTSGDITNFTNKVMSYTESPVVSESDEALFVGELLWDDPTWGGTYQEEVRLGSSNHGYTTVGFVPGDMVTDTLYEMDAGSWTVAQLISLMENGTNIVSHLGHCNNDYFMKMGSSDIPSFDNDGTTHTLNFVYTQGCYGGAFDNRNSSFSYTSDCFSENFACDDDGAVAIVSNTRYGWGAHSSTNGSSQYFNREFFDAIFGEDIYPLGHVNDDSKVDVLWAITYGANKWCYYELTLFGDPSMELWTDEPVAMSVSHDPTVMVGQPDFDVTVTDGRAPIEGARVSIYTDDLSVADSGVTDASGVVTLHPNSTTTGTLHVKAMSNNFLVSNTTANIIPTSGVYLAMDDHAIDDDTTGESNGNDDGEVGAGEMIELTVTVGNFGTDMANGVTATLSTTSGRLTFFDDTESFGNIAGGGSAVCLDDFEFTVSPDTPAGEVIPLTLTMSDASRATWQSTFNLVVRAPSLAYQAVAVSDPAFGGNENGCPEPAEVIELTVSINNSGDARATGITGTLSTTDPYVSISEPTAGLPFLNVGATSVLTPSFTVTILPSAPVDHDIVFDVDVTADWGYTASSQFTVRTLGNDLADDIESGEGLWTHGNVTSGFADEWHVETYRSNSTSHSWKFGGSGSGVYANSSDGALYMKPICLGTDGSMTCWHWMSAEEESSTSAWDCGLVQISSDGGATWDVLYPNGGYSHTKNSNDANPLPEGTPCWSGSFGWTQETFDLTAYEHTVVQIRFRFAADGYVQEEGWYIDDVNLTSTGSPTGIPGEEEVPRTFALRQNVPNPFNPVTRIAYDLPNAGHVKIDVFNIAGRHVTTLVDEHQDAGVKAVTWDGKNAAGEKVASGIYMYRMDAGDHTSRKMMVLLK